MYRHCDERRTQSVLANMLAALSVSFVDCSGASTGMPHCSLTRYLSHLLFQSVPSGLLLKSSCTQVYKGIKDKVHDVAIKIFKSANTARDLELLQMEIAVLRSCNNKNIVHFYGVSFKGSDAWLVMELLEKGNLYNALAFGHGLCKWYNRCDCTRFDSLELLAREHLVRAYFPMLHLCHAEVLHVHVYKHFVQLVKYTLCMICSCSSCLLHQRSAPNMLVSQSIPVMLCVCRGAQIALDIAKGIHFLHSHRIMHLDLKSPNILLATDGTAKIADVGLSRIFTTRSLPVAKVSLSSVSVSCRSCFSHNVKK